MSGGQSVVGRICPSCGAEPEGAVGPNCAACGTKLIEVRAAVDELIGSVIDDRFEVRELLGRGGMGSVYKALQRSVGREVAIKLIDARAASDPMAVRRFLREARLASQLSQANTVTVIDFGQSQDGRLFLAMELVRGRTLADVIDADAPLPVGRSADICMQICDALEAAHALGILHRDLKPTNVMLADDAQRRDRVKILDFGLAKSLRDDESRATQAGIVMGTPGYLSPELLRGAEPSVASDLYSIGVILAEMVSGRQVWSSQVTREMQAQQERGLPPQLQVPEEIRPVLAKLLAPSPAERHASAAELRADLSTLAGVGARLDSQPQALGRPSSRPTVDVRPKTQRKWRLRELWPVAAGGLALLLGAGLLLRLRSQPAPAQLVASAAPPPATSAALAPVAVAPPPRVEPPVPAQAPSGETVLIRVNTNPQGARIMIDGALRGTSPAQVPVPRGRRFFELALGTRVWREPVDVDHDDELNVEFPATGR